MRAAALIALTLTVCFAAQFAVVDLLGKPYDIYLALSAYGMRNGHLWEIATSLFMHAGPLHFVVNLLALFLLGPAVEGTFGAKSALRHFGLAGLAGSIVAATAALLCAAVPLGWVGTELVLDRLGGPVVTSSAGLFGWFAALCTLEGPSWIERVTRPAWIWGVAALVSIWWIAVPEPQLSQLSHLGALGWGWHWARRRNRRDYGGNQAP